MAMNNYYHQSRGQQLPTATVEVLYVVLPTKVCRLPITLDPYHRPTQSNNEHCAVRLLKPSTNGGKLHRTQSPLPIPLSNPLIHPPPPNPICTPPHTPPPTTPNPSIKSPIRRRPRRLISPSHTHLRIPRSPRNPHALGPANTNRTLRPRSHGVVDGWRGTAF